MSLRRENQINYVGMGWVKRKYSDVNARKEDLEIRWYSRPYTSVSSDKLIYSNLLLTDLVAKTMYGQTAYTLRYFPGKHVTMLKPGQGIIPWMCVMLNIMPTRLLICETSSDSLARLSYQRRK
jgi:hypothetical protein